MSGNARRLGEVRDVPDELKQSAFDIILLELPRNSLFATMGMVYFP
jgi:hypothetical protein